MKDDITTRRKDIDNEKRVNQGRSIHKESKPRESDKICDEREAESASNH